jgi:hypothetical protein
MIPGLTEYAASKEVGDFVVSLIEVNGLPNEDGQT